LWAILSKGLGHSFGFFRFVLGVLFLDCCGVATLIIVFFFFSAADLDIFSPR